MSVCLYAGYLTRSKVCHPILTRQSCKFYFTSAIFVNDMSGLLVAQIFSAKSFMAVPSMRLIQSRSMS